MASSIVLLDEREFATLIETDFFLDYECDMYAVFAPRGTILIENMGGGNYTVWSSRTRNESIEITVLKNDTGNSDFVRQRVFIYVTHNELRLCASDPINNLKQIMHDSPRDYQRVCNLARRYGFQPMSLFE